jgi:hypothetical protein
MGSQSFRAAGMGGTEFLLPSGCLILLHLKNFRNPSLPEEALSDLIKATSTMIARFVCLLGQNQGEEGLLMRNC